MRRFIRRLALGEISISALVLLTVQLATAQGMSQTCREVQRFNQAENRDLSGRISAEAAVIHVVDCGGKQFYVYQYVNRPGFRAIRPPDWGHAIGGRDYSTFAEALGAAASVAGGAGGGNAGRGAGGDVFGPMENGYALNGTRLTYFPRAIVGQCLRDCADNASCEGFTWIPAGTYNPGDAAMCYLLSAVTGRTSAAGHISALKGAAGNPGGGGNTGGGTSVAPQETQYLGCFKDQENRDIGADRSDSSQMTTESCRAYCQGKGYTYAATQYASVCFCGNSYGKYGPAGNCDAKCTGNPGEICGGSWANSVYLAK